MKWGLQFFPPNISKIHRIHENRRPWGKDLFGRLWEEAWWSGGAVRLGRKEPLGGAFMRGDCGGHLGCRLGPLQDRAEGNLRTVSLRVEGSSRVFSLTPFLHSLRGASGHSYALWAGTFRFLWQAEECVFATRKRPQLETNLTLKCKLIYNYDFA